MGDVLEKGRVALFEDSTFLASLPDLESKNRFLVHLLIVQVLQANDQLGSEYSIEDVPCYPSLPPGLLLPPLQPQL